MEGSGRGQGWMKLVQLSASGPLCLLRHSTFALMSVLWMPSLTRLGKMSMRGAEVVNVEEYDFQRPRRLAPTSASRPSFSLIVPSPTCPPGHSSAAPIGSPPSDPTWLEWGPPLKVLGGAASDKEVVVATHGMALQPPTVGGAVGARDRRKLSIRRRRR
uniref:Uncharacterized protein n=1 Tax=Oryza punctata TaxID=4537 RepID=A0A0E0L181_ORYPU